MDRDPFNSDTNPVPAPDGAPGVSHRRRLAVFLSFAALLLAAYLAGPAVYRLIVPAPASSDLAARSGAASSELSSQSVKLSGKQLEAVTVAPAGTYDFKIEQTATGSIDFNQDMTVQVFSPYPGRILTLFARIGDEVKAGQTLFTIDSPDLLQAESALIQAAGVLQLTTRVMTRTQKLLTASGAAQKDLDQAISDQQTADGNLKAARRAVRIFGKDEFEIDRIVADRKVDSSLIVPCPISGTVTARNAAPGLFVQPGTTPAPFSIADLSTVWLNAYVVESEIPTIALGQEVEARVMAFPDRSFEGKVTAIGAAVDPATRRLLVRSEIKDPEHLLRPGMFARFVIRTGKPLRSPALPLDGIVREGDGTMSAWVTADGQVFTRRTVQTGLRQNGFVQILEGVRAGEEAVTQGAIFLSNMLAGGNG